MSLYHQGQTEANRRLLSKLAVSWCHILQNVFSLQTSDGRRSHTCDSRLNCNFFYLFFVVTQIQMLISYPVVPFTLCHVLLGVVYCHCLGSINKEIPMLSFIQRHDNTPSSLPYNPPSPLEVASCTMPLDAFIMFKQLPLQQRV